MPTSFPAPADSSATLLALVQSFARLKGLPSVGGVQGTADAGVAQIKELLQSVGEDLMDRTDWQFLIRTASWTAVASDDQGALVTLASENFQRALPDTFWNLTEKLPFQGPLAQQDWQQLTSLGTTPHRFFRIAEGRLWTSGGVSVGDSLSFLYHSGDWVLDSSGSPKAYLSADSDVPQFPRRLMLLGLDFFWKRLKELPYKVEQDRYEQTVEDLAGRSVARPVLNMGEGLQPPLPGIVVPRQSWSL
jgi:hypothetical protein